MTSFTDRLFSWGALFIGAFFIVIGILVPLGVDISISKGFLYTSLGAGWLAFADTLRRT